MWMLDTVGFRLPVWFDRENHRSPGVSMYVTYQHVDVWHHTVSHVCFSEALDEFSPQNQVLSRVFGWFPGCRNVKFFPVLSPPVVSGVLHVTLRESLTSCSGSTGTGVLKYQYELYSVRELNLIFRDIFQRQSVKIFFSLIGETWIWLIRRVSTCSVS